MVKTGSINMAKAIRRIGHRSGQARKLTFFRDAIEAKDEYGVEYDTVASGNESITIPNIDAFISPIVTKSDSLTRAGHTVVGNATIYIPPLSTIKNSVIGISDAGVYNAKLSRFNEFESKDILYDMERILESDVNNDPERDLYVLRIRYDQTADAEIDFMDGTVPAFEMDRLQFKIKADDVLDYILIDTKVANVQATLKWDGSLTLSGDNYTTIDVPIDNIGSGDITTLYARSHLSGDSGANFTAAIAGAYNLDKCIGDSNNRIDKVDIELAGSATVDVKDVYFYKAGEWRIEAIKEYRDEYMELGCVKIRGERGSRRRAY